MQMQNKPFMTYNTQYKELSSTRILNFTELFSFWWSMIYITTKNC